MTLRYGASLTQIFELQRALEEMEGAGANFYSILGLKASATLAQIRKAYREKSLEWQYVFALTQPRQKLGCSERVQALRATRPDPQDPA